MASTLESHDVLRIMSEQTGINDLDTICRALRECNGDVVDAIASLLFPGRQGRPAQKPFAELTDVEKLRVVMAEKEQMFHSMMTETTKTSDKCEKNRLEYQDHQENQKYEERP